MGNTDSDERVCRYLYRPDSGWRLCINQKIGDFEIADLRTKRSLKPGQKITRVRGNQAALAGTLFLLLTDFLIPSNSDFVDLSFALLYNG
jgi:hypothetical protein